MAAPDHRGSNDAIVAERFEGLHSASVVGRAHRRLLSAVAVALVVVPCIFLVQGCSLTRELGETVSDEARRVELVARIRSELALVSDEQDKDESAVWAHLHKSSLFQLEALLQTIAGDRKLALDMVFSTAKPFLVETVLEALQSAAVANATFPDAARLEAAKLLGECPWRETASLSRQAANASTDSGTALRTAVVDAITPALAKRFASSPHLMFCELREAPCLTAALLAQQPVSWRIASTVKICIATWLEAFRTGEVATMLISSPLLVILWWLWTCCCRFRRTPPRNAGARAGRQRSVDAHDSIGLSSAARGQQRQPTTSLSMCAGDEQEPKPEEDLKSPEKADARDAERLIQEAKLHVSASLLDAAASGQLHDALAPVQRAESAAGADARDAEKLIEEAKLHVASSLLDAAASGKLHDALAPGLGGEPSQEAGAEHSVVAAAAAGLSSNAQLFNLYSDEFVDVGVQASAVEAETGSQARLSIVVADPEAMQARVDLVNHALRMSSEASHQARKSTDIAGPEAMQARVDLVNHALRMSSGGKSSGSDIASLCPDRDGGEQSQAESTYEPLNRSPLPDRGDGYRWLRVANEESDRALRRDVAQQTLQACTSGCAWSQQLRMDACREQTELVTITDLLDHKPESRGTANVWRSEKFPLEAAVEAARRQESTLVVSAASAYNPGGGFMSGGRHALEESMCVQSSLYPCLQHAEQLAVQRAELHQDQHCPSHTNPPTRRDGTRWKRYIPIRGAVLAPGISVFRGGTHEGYPFWEEPVRLAGVVSIAMFNRNPKVSDCPCDAPEDPEYAAAMRDTFCTVLLCARKVNATTVVIPDVGCGVFQNSAGDVGKALGEALNEYGCGLQIVLTGQEAFFQAVSKAMSSSASGPQVSNGLQNSEG